MDILSKESDVITLKETVKGIYWVFDQRANQSARIFAQGPMTVEIVERDVVGIENLPLEARDFPHLPNDWKSRCARFSGYKSAVLFV